MPMQTSPANTTNPPREQILREVKRIVGEQMDLAPEEIHRDNDLVQDLGCDSLDVMEISMNTEEHYQVRVPDDAAQAIKTVGDIVDGVAQLLDDRSNTA